MSRPAMFGKIRGNVRATSSSNRSEIDLRNEFDVLVYGDSQHIPHGHLVVVRNMRRDPDGYATKCVCLEVQQTVGPDPDCSYCLGEGYLWDENWGVTYSMHLNADSGLARKYMHMAPGLERTDYVVFFFRYDTNVNYEDKIVEMKLDLEGAPVLPYIRDAIYKPHTIKRLRADYGRVEYIGVFCREDDAWRSDTPS